MIENVQNVYLYYRNKDIFGFKLNMLPTITSANLFWVEDGCPRAGKTVTGCFMPKDFETCVRCCSHDGMSCTTPLNCGAQNNWMTYDDAEAKCVESGKRLCKKEELLDNVCCGKGGGGDNWLVWAL